MILVNATLKLCFDSFLTAVSIRLFILTPVVGVFDYSYQRVLLKP
ncbi:TPA: hypothetical protein ACPSKE_003269 [Legionella feeleii]